MQICHTAEREFIWPRSDPGYWRTCHYSVCKIDQNSPKINGEALIIVIRNALNNVQDGSEQLRLHPSRTLRCNHRIIPLIAHTIGACEMRIIEDALISLIGYLWSESPISLSSLRSQSWSGSPRCWNAASDHLYAPITHCVFSDKSALCIG